MKSVALKAHPRSLARSRGVKKVRTQGRIPAVIYGRATTPQNLEVERKDLEHLMHHSVSETRLVDLSIEGDTRAKRLALLQQVQHHPLSGAVLHVDLREVSETEKVTVHVPVETSGESAGVKSGGGILEHVLFRIRVRALPRDLPEFIQIDVTSLEVGHSIHISDIQPPPGVEILGDPGIPVVSVAIPRAAVEEEAAPGAAAPAGEVEMIKEKKDDKGGKPEAGAAPAAGGKGEAKGEAKGGAKEAKPEAKAGDKGGAKK